MKITSKIIVLFTLIIHASFVFAQDYNSSFITVEKKLLGYDFIYAGEKLTYSQLRKLLKEVPLTKDDVNSALALSVPEFFLDVFSATICGVVLGHMLVETTVSGKGLLLCGGVVGVDALLHVKSNDNYKSAVDIYNNEIQKYNKTSKRHLKVNLGLNYIGFSLDF